MLLPRHPPAVWWAAAVEIRSAIERLHRSGGLDLAAKGLALARLREARLDWTEVVPSDAVRNKAEALLEAYPLRAADSLQLAAALIWCRNRPAGRTFISSDGRLCDAAALEGFTILRP